MFKPDLYQKSNSDTRRDVLECLEKFAPKLRWGGPGGRVLDVGSGDGSVTASVLRQFLPHAHAQLVGADIGPEMVAYANTRYGDHRTTFIQLDIGDTIPPHITAKFDNVFSFYTLHWIQDQERAFTNIHKLLNDGGQCLLLFVRYNPIQDIYLTLANHDRWQHWLTNVQQYISPYRDLQDPVGKVKEIMKKVGFTNIQVECEDKQQIYEEQHFRNTMEAICPFKIPTDQMDDFMDDYMQLVKKMNLMHIKDNRPIVHTHYNLLVAHGTKGKEEN